MFTSELRRQKVVFAAADTVALIAAFAAALTLHDPSNAMARRIQGDPTSGIVAAVACVGLWLGVFRANDLYRMRNGGLRELLAVTRACAIAALLTLMGVFLAHLDASRITVVLACILSVPFVSVARAAARAAICRVYARAQIAIPLVMIGFNQAARYLFDQIVDEMTPYEPVGFIDDGPNGRRYRGCPILGGCERLRELAAAFPTLEAAIAMPDAPQSHLEDLIALCERHRVRWWIAPWMLRSLASGASVETLGVIPLIGRRGSNLEGLNFAVKRAFDLVLASLLLVLAAPVLALAALGILLDDGRPILFRQIRVGIRGQAFEMLKLRTMRRSAGDAEHRRFVRQWIRERDGKASGSNGATQRVFKLVDDERVTRIGRILRRFSIDELPQLINVIRGQMSLIGPRPALAYELEFYEDWHRRRLDTVPGITGLWQVSGRNRLSFDEMVRLDLQYVEDWSLTNDIKILAQTLPVLIRGNGL
jgi:exopolysaccharide biosynthesis polyprenyl glycosylphosphotransferase